MNNLFTKILNNLARPHKIPKKILNKYNYYFSYKKYNQNFFEEEQNKIFEHFGLNRQEGIKKLISTKKDLDFKLKDSEMSSEHEVIFSSLSYSKNKSFTDILEIGTFDASTALLMTKIFPGANIKTLDLNTNDEIFFKPASYSASKSAILNLTRYLGVYWAKNNVRVNSLILAGVFNDQDEEFLKSYCSRIPIGRMAFQDDYNGALIFLASDSSSYMTGSDLVIDGGWTAI